MEFPTGEPPSDMIPFLPPSVKELSFQVNLAVREQHRRLVDCLGQLSSPRAPLRSLSVIRLTSSTIDPFRWWTISNRSIALAGELMTLSMRLAEVGIHVTDDEDKWMARLG
ncbi:hypothetical protein CALVIDRAFT_537320 [Calocera viscosa TUFC12733]|uniref:Uncharacterized protein n=1 Tax=Calocera viscosa (strain TUFC12733) TaxID=1330018 RepID=A0A167LXF6_CALVF|nr:hypothetical protein CALVIDRAFT_537320 [Calocera viscosa TUFC12733]